MRYQFHGKYHRGDKLTRDQHREIAMLTNAGVHYKTLSQDYGVTYPTIHAIVHKQGAILGHKTVARWPTEKFAYAQWLYRQPAVTARMKSHLERDVFTRFAAKVGLELLVERAEEKLLTAIIGHVPYPPSLSAEQLGASALAVITHGIARGENYREPADAASHAGPRIVKLAQREFTPLQRRYQKMIDGRLLSLLSALPQHEQAILRAHYGLGRNTESLAQIGARMGKKKQAVWMQERKAIRTLKIFVETALSRR